MSKKIEEIIMWFSTLDILSIDIKQELINKFGSIENLWNCSLKELDEKLNKSLAEKIAESRSRFDELEERALKLNMRFVSVLDEEYPENLKKIANYPLGFFIYGELPDKNKKSAGIVGSRKITDYGRLCTSEISSELADRGIVIVSGMAEGIDGIAHEAALNVNGKTIAVMGSGLNVVYPKCNQELYERIISSGNCVISEYLPDTRPISYHFPLRNRIISGLSDVLVVVEAAQKSGSLITASYAAEQGRSVYAVPGNINSLNSVGCNNLIKNGANILCNVSDLLYDLGIYENNKTKRTKKNSKNTSPKETKPKNAKINKKTETPSNKIHTSDENKKETKNLNLELEPFEKIVYDCIGYENITLDEVLERTNLSIQQAQLYLTLLESKNLIRAAGGKYIRISE